jgi:hypothetical protein
MDIKPKTPEEVAMQYVETLKLIEENIVIFTNEQLTNVLTQLFNDQTGLVVRKCTPQI